MVSRTSMRVAIGSLTYWSASVLQQLLFTLVVGVTPITAAQTNPPTDRAVGHRFTCINADDPRSNRQLVAPLDSTASATITDPVGDARLTSIYDAPGTHVQADSSTLTITIPTWLLNDPSQFTWYAYAENAASDGRTQSSATWSGGTSTITDPPKNIPSSLDISTATVRQIDNTHLAMSIAVRGTLDTDSDADYEIIINNGNIIVFAFPNPPSFGGWQFEVDNTAGFTRHPVTAYEDLTSVSADLSGGTMHLSATTAAPLSSTPASSDGEPQYGWFFTGTTRFVIYKYDSAARQWHGTVRESNGTFFSADVSSNLTVSVSGNTLSADVDAATLQLPATIAFRGTTKATFIDGSDVLYANPMDYVPNQGYFAITCTGTCAATVPAAGMASQLITFTASYQTASAAPASCASNLSYQWRFGDNARGTGGSVTHAYTAAGTYTWTLLVTSDAGDVCTKTGTITVATPQVLNVLAIEVTQGIQDLNNSVPLLAGKQTVARVHTRATSVTSITGILTAAAQNVELGSVRITKNVGPLWSRADPGASFNFTLPANWTIGTVELRFTATGANLTCATGQPPCRTTVTFSPSASLHVRFVPIQWSSNGTSTVFTPSDNDIKSAARDIANLFPVGNVLAETRPPLSIGFQPTNAIDFALLLLRLRWYRFWDTPSTDAPYYLGVLANPPSGAAVVGSSPYSITGDCQLDPSHLGVGYTTPHTLAHELGHAAGLMHVAYTGAYDTCGNADKTCTKYSNPTGTLASTAADQTYYGFDTNAMTPITPDHPDLMTYGCQRWISVPAYNRLRQQLQTTTALFLADAAATSMLIISGVTNGTTGSFDTLAITDTTLPASPFGNGAYAVWFEDGVGQQLALLPFDPDPIAETTAGTFFLIVSIPPATARLKLVQGAVTLDTRTVSAHAPEVHIDTPATGQNIDRATTINWTASDQDNDILSFTIQYSADAGTTWTTLATNVSSTTYELPFDHIARSNAALLRIIASDGFNTTTSQSPTFRVANHAPAVEIVQPSPDAVVVGDTTILFVARADDIDGDAVTINWSADGQALGQGASLQFAATDLGLGRHTISVIATDAVGGQNVANTAITIAPIVPPRRRAAAH